MENIFFADTTYLMESQL